LGGEKTQTKITNSQENHQEPEKIPKNQENQKTRKSFFNFSFNTESFHFNSSSKMPPITRQQNNSKKTPYNGASIEENTQKPPKKVKNQHNNNNSETRSKNHVTMPRDVTPNASTSNNNNSSNSQAIPEIPTYPNSNIDNIELDTDDWTDIQYNTRHKIFIPMEKTELKKRAEKRKKWKTSSQVTSESLAPTLNSLMTPYTSKPISP